MRAVEGAEDASKTVDAKATRAELIMKATLLRNLAGDGPEAAARRDAKSGCGQSPARGEQLGLARVGHVLGRQLCWHCRRLCFSTCGEALPFGRWLERGGLHGCRRAPAAGAISGVTPVPVLLHLVKWSVGE